MKTTPAAAPRTYTFSPPARYGFHAEFTTTCPSFCTAHHPTGTDEDPVDVWHSMSGGALELPLATPGGQVEECTVFEAYVTVRSYSLDPAYRVPHASVAVLDSAETGPLDPDAFAMVIDQFAAQVERMRELHAVLVEAVAEHQGGAQ